VQGWKVDPTHDQFAAIAPEGKEDFYLDNPILIQKTAALERRGLNQYSEDYVQESLGKVGPNKPVGYLPLPTIVQSGFDPEEVETADGETGSGMEPAIPVDLWAVRRGSQKGIYDAHETESRTSSSSRSEG
jgi:hypothetical protein